MATEKPVGGASRRARGSTGDYHLVNKIALVTFLLRQLLIIKELHLTILKVLIRSIHDHVEEIPVEKQ